MLALVLLVAGWGVPLAFPHLAGDDLLCAIAERAEGGETRLAEREASRADHCDVCHALRSFRAARVDDRATDLVLVAGGIPPAVSISGPSRPAAHRLPARAPPA